MSNKNPRFTVLNVLFDGRMGGPPRRVISVGEKLARDGVTTIICVPVESEVIQKQAKLGGLSCATLPFRKVPRLTHPVKVVLWLFSQPLAIRRFQKLYLDIKPDIVHVNGAFFLAPAVAAWFQGRCLVWHLNDTIVPPLMAIWLGRIVQRFADRVVIAAEAVGKHYGIKSEKSVIIHAPVDVQKFRAFGGDRNAKSRRVPVVAILANWNPIKGLEYFVQAMQIVRQRFGPLKIIMAGTRLDTHRTYADKIERLIVDCGLDPYVDRPGFVDNVTEVLDRVDCLVSSSLSEACPMAVLEGMAAGVPVVATDVGGVREMLVPDSEHPAGLIIPSCDAEALASAVVQILNKEIDVDCLVRQARIRVEKEYSLDECSRKHADLYRNLVRPTDI